MGNQGSTGYLVIHLSVVRAMPGLRCHTSCLFVWGCGLQLSEPCGLSWFSARGVRPWYRECTVLFQNTCTTLAGSYNNDNIILYVGKRLWYGTQLSTTLVRLIITNQTSDICQVTHSDISCLFTVVTVDFYLYVVIQLYFSSVVYHVIQFLISTVILVITLCTLFICTSFSLYTHSS